LVEGQLQPRWQMLRSRSLSDACTCASDSSGRPQSSRRCSQTASGGASADWQGRRRPPTTGPWCRPAGAPAFQLALLSVEPEQSPADRTGAAGARRRPSAGPGRRAAGGAWSGCGTWVCRFCRRRTPGAGRVLRAPCLRWRVASARPSCCSAAAAPSGRAARPGWGWTKAGWGAASSS